MKLELATAALRAVPVQLIDLGDGVVLKRGRVELKIAGAEANAVVRELLAASRQGASREEIVERFAVGERAAVEALIDHLLQRGLLITDSGAEPAAADTPLDVFYWHFGVRAADANERLQQQRIGVLGVNHISRQLVRSLHTAGVSMTVVDDPLLRHPALFDGDDHLSGEQWAPAWGTPLPASADTGELDPEAFDCLVATCDVGGSAQLQAWNEHCVLHGRHFLPVLLRDLVGYVGPLVVPGDTACYECLRWRQNAHLVDPAGRRACEAAYLQGDAVVGFHPAMASILGDIAAMELTKLYALPAIAKTGALLEVNLLGGEMRYRRVLKLPRCPVCSSLRRTPSAPLARAVLLPNDGDGR